MTMEFTRHNMNFLVHNYMKSMGLTKAASVFDLESNLGNVVDITPTFSLIDIISKGVKYVAASEIIGEPELDFQSVITEIMENNEDFEPLVSNQSDTNEMNLSSNDNTKNSFGNFKDVHWNTGGSLLAAGMTDGSVQLWETGGRIFKRLTGHIGPVNSVRWNKRGNYILSSGTDGSVLIWDTKSGAVKQCFKLKGGPIFNIDWRKNTAFAASSYAKIIYLCKINIDIPLKIFRGHNDQILCLKWDSQGNTLASGSADKTLRLWSLKSCFTALSHSDGVHSIAWSNGLRWGDNTLASACYDSTIRIWDIFRATNVGVMSGHGNFESTLSFSPDNKLLASGGKDGILKVWSTHNYTLIRCVILPFEVASLRWNGFKTYSLQICTTRGEVINYDLRLESNLLQQLNI